MKVVSIQPGEAYTVALNGDLFSYSCKDTDSAEAILGGLQAMIQGADDGEFTAEVDEEAVVLKTLTRGSTMSFVIPCC